ncbi:MAG: MarR family transcriptional regulator [Clostridia bacterium]|nr:MarR family transcriptional regulator [Clostridia bacterium]
MREQYPEMDLNKRIIWNFWDISHTMRRISEGKGSQKRILILLLEEGKALTQKELTDRLEVQPGSVSEVLGKLENAGLIIRTPNAEDRRTIDICLTADGEKAAKEAYQRRCERHTQMFTALTDTEKETLLGLLEKINLDWAGKYKKEEEK